MYSLGSALHPTAARVIRRSELQPGRVALASDFNLKRRLSKKAFRYSGFVGDGRNRQILIQPMPPRCARRQPDLAAR